MTAETLCGLLVTETGKEPRTIWDGIGWFHRDGGEQDPVFRRNGRKMSKSSRPSATASTWHSRYRRYVL